MAWVFVEESKEWFANIRLDGTSFGIGSRFIDLETQSCSSSNLKTIELFSILKPCFNDLANPTEDELNMVDLEYGYGSAEAYKKFVYDILYVQPTRNKQNKIMNINN